MYTLPKPQKSKRISFSFHYLNIARFCTRNLRLISIFLARHTANHPLHCDESEKEFESEVKKKKPDRFALFFLVAGTGLSRRASQSEWT